MKVLWLTLFFTITFLHTWASPTLVYGYIILPGGDTLRGQIKFGGMGGGTTWKEVTFVDATGVEKKYKAQNGEVKGYGFESMGTQKDYIYFLLKNKGNSRWFERVSKGSNYTVYATSITGSYGTVDITSIWYILEKPSGEYLFIDACATCPWRKNLTLFLEDNPNAISALENIRAKEVGVFLRSISK